MGNIKIYNDTALLVDLQCIRKVYEEKKACCEGRQSQSIFSWTLCGMGHSCVNSFYSVTLL